MIMRVISSAFLIIQSQALFFKDVTPLFKDPECFHAVVDDIAEHFADAGITKVIGAEARGFLVGTPVAYKLGAGFVPARKPGKLPREVYAQAYDLEYGTSELQIHTDALTPDDVVLIADDLVATGGTCVACAQLAEKAGAKVAGFAFALELCYCTQGRLLVSALTKRSTPLLRFNKLNHLHQTYFNLTILAGKTTCLSAICLIYISILLITVNLFTIHRISP